jgi:glycosylphosphatidylinositol deacylase
MLWILPINLPTLVVWIHNLTVHWLTPFSSHHNVLSILPFVLLVETLSTGKMLPRLRPTSASAPPSVHGSQSPIKSAVTTTITSTPSSQPSYLPTALPPTRLAHHCTSILFFSLAAYAGLYGVTYAYLLHFIVNGCAAWLMLIYYACGRERGLKGVTDLLENSGAEGDAIGAAEKSKEESGGSEKIGDDVEEVDGRADVQEGEGQKRESPTAAGTNVNHGRRSESGRGHSHAKKEP